MDLSRHVLNDLSDVTTLYERKLCSLNVVQLKVSRAAQAFRLDRPEWSDQLVALAERIADADARKVEYLEGMELMDQIRRWVKDPPSAPRPTLELVRDATPEPAPAVQAAPDEVEAPEPSGERPPIDAIPDDATEPARPSNLPRRTL